MLALFRPSFPKRDATGFVLLAGIVALTLATASIHAQLGGLLFLLNAAGYVTLAAGMAAPIAIAERLRWLTRLALMGFTLATIVGWYLIGPRFDLAYLTKGIEVALVGLLAIDFVRTHGSPLAAARRSAGFVAQLLARP
jgi:uncharacterized membrane protein